MEKTSLNPIEYWTSSSGGVFHLVKNDGKPLCGRIGGNHEDGAARIFEGHLEKRILSRHYPYSEIWILAYHPDYCMQCLKKAGFIASKQVDSYLNDVTYKSVMKDFISYYQNKVVGKLTTPCHK